MIRFIESGTYTDQDAAIDAAHDKEAKEFADKYQNEIKNFIEQNAEGIKLGEASHNLPGILKFQTNFKWLRERAVIVVYCSPYLDNKIECYFKLGYDTIDAFTITAELKNEKFVIVDNIRY